MSIVLVAGCNQRYHDRFQACVAALRTYTGDIPYRLFSVGYNGYTELTQAQNYGAPPETECIQHGSFLQKLPGRPDDVIVYLDGDVIMQRPLDAGELAWLENFPERAVAATWNQIDETLAQCATYIGPKNTETSLAQIWVDADIDQAPSLNAGMVVMRRSAWKQSYELYLRHWELAGACFSHQARQQWLMCWTYAALGFETQIMPWSFHAHGHFGLKPGMERRPDGIYADGKLAAFRHHT